MKMATDVKNLEQEKAQEEKQARSSGWCYSFPEEEQKGHHQGE